MLPWRPRLAGILGVLALIGAPMRAEATEKHWKAAVADTIVVGTFRPTITIPWFDGWHIKGVIRVDEVLYGRAVPRELPLLLVCRWDELCRRWPVPHFPPVYQERGLWFLRHADDRTWSPTDAFGYQRLQDRAYWEEYIRRYKR